MVYAWICFFFVPLVSFFVLFKRSLVYIVLYSHILKVVHNTVLTDEGMSLMLNILYDISYTSVPPKRLIRLETNILHRIKKYYCFIKKVKNYIFLFYNFVKIRKKPYYWDYIMFLNILMFKILIFIIFLSVYGI